MKRFITEFYLMTTTNSIAFTDGTEAYKHREDDYYDHQNDYTETVHFIQNMDKNKALRFLIKLTG